MPIPILTLTTDKPKRLNVTIDGKPYGVRTDKELGLGQLVRLDRIAPRIGALLEQDSDADGDELTRLLIKAVSMALVAPPSVVAKLTNVQRAAVFSVYLQAAGPALQTLRGAINRPVSMKGKRRG